MSALSTPAGGGIITAASSSAASTTTSSTTAGTKGTTSGKIKFQKLDINNLYCHGKSESSEPTSNKSTLSRKHGMQILGKVPSARRPPANLPSLKTESGLEVNTTTSPPTQTSTGQSVPSTQQQQTQGAQLVAPAAAGVTHPGAQAPPGIAQPPGQTALHPHQICPPQNTPSHPHAGGYQGGWTGLPHHRTAQFQQEFPSLDGSTPTPPPPAPVQNNQQTPAQGGLALRPHTEGGWLAGGARADGLGLAADPRSQLARTLPLPSFMVKGSPGMGGGGYPGIMMPPPARGGPNRGPPQHHGPSQQLHNHSQQQHHHHPQAQPPPQQVHHRAREVPTIEKLMQRPIIKEEELYSMDEITNDAGWAVHDDIDYNQKLAFSDDESTPSKDPPPTTKSSSGKNNQQQDKDKEKEKELSGNSLSGSNSGSAVNSSSANVNSVSCSSNNSSGVTVSREPPVLTKNMEDEKLWAMRQRQREMEVNAAVERARQRKEQDERRYQQQLQDKDDRNTSDLQQGTQSSSISQDWSKDIPEKSPSAGRDSDVPRPPSHGPPNLDRSASRDSVRNGPTDQTDFKQTSSGERNYRDNKDRDRERPRDREYQRDNRDFYREKDADRERDWDRDRNRDSAPPRSERDRDRENTRQDRDGQGFNKYSNYNSGQFSSNIPPRFAKQQGRAGGHQQERMGFERVEFARTNSGNSFNDSNKHRNNESRNEEKSAFSQQYDTSRWSLPNMKNAPGGVQREPFKRGQDEKNVRRDSEKEDDRRRERHTPDEPRGPRHPTRKLSGSSDGRHQSNRDYDERDDDYRWEKDHDRRSGSSFDDKKHSEYDRENSYDWRSSDKDYGNEKSRNYRDIDRQNSRESQKDIDRKSDYDRKSSDSYEAKNSAEKLPEMFDRKCVVGQEFNDRKSDSSDQFMARKSLDKYDRQDSNKQQPDRPDSRDSRNSRDSVRETFKQDSFSEKEYQCSWTDFPNEQTDKESNNYSKNSNITIKGGFQEKPNFSEKTDSNKNESYPGNYRDRKDYKSDSDESKKSGGYAHQHVKKNSTSIKKLDLSSSKEKTQAEETPVSTPKEDTNSNAVAKTEPSCKAWADSLSPSSIINECNAKSQKAESNKSDNLTKETENKTETKYHDLGKDKIERKLSSSGSEKKSHIGGTRSRLDSGGSRKGYVFYNTERGSWGRGRSDGGRRPGRGRSNRDPVYSESEVSGDEERSRGGSGRGKGNRGGGQFGGERKRHDSRGEAFAPRGEPSRRGRGSFRGRGAVHGNYPPSSKSPFGQNNANSTDLPENDPNKPPVDSLTSDEKIKLKQQALSAGIIGKDRKNTTHNRSGHDKGKKKSGAPASTEEEAWETTSEHSEGGKLGGNKNNVKHGSSLSVDKEKKQGGQPSQQSKGSSNVIANRQNSSGSITKSGQANKKDIPPSIYNTNTTVMRADDIKHDAGGVTSSFNKQKDHKSDKEVDDNDEQINDGFQEVKSKNKEKTPRTGAPLSKDEPQNSRLQSQKSQPNNKGGEVQRNNSTTRNSTEKSTNSGPTNRSSNTNVSNAATKVNGPVNVSAHERHNMGPPQNKSNQFVRPSNLPPRLARQREHNRMQKQINQGFGQQSNSDIGCSVPIAPSSAWDKPISQTLRGTDGESPVAAAVSNSDCNDLGLSENHSEQSSQRSTPSNQTSEQKAPGNREKTNTFDGTNTPVQTVIFENTNYKSAPNDVLKQKFSSGGTVSQPSQSNSSNHQKQASCLPSKTIVSLTSQASDLENQMLAFPSENQQTNTFMSDLMNQVDPSQGTVKSDSTPLQLPLSFVSKTPEDSSDMKLDFFDSELSQLTDDKSGKSLGIRSMRSISSPSQNTLSTATDQELNMKIASVKKVWDTSAVLEHQVPDESTHNQHGQHMSVSSPHSLASQHNISNHHMTSQHNLASQHSLASQHNLSQQLGSPQSMSQHNLVSQHGLGSQHNMTAVQFTSSFEDHQNNCDVSQSQGFSPGANGNISNQTTNVCKVKPTQQTHSTQGMTQSALQNMQASLISQNTALGLSQAATALQSMGNVSQGIQGVGGVMGLSPPPMAHAYNHLPSYPPSQYGGISAIPSPPTVVFNSSQPILNSSQQLPSQGGLYNAFQIDQSRSQFGAFPGGPYGAGSTPYNYQPQDMFQGLQSQYRMQDLFQAAGSAAFGQSGQLGTNPSTVLISSSSNSLMSASVKPSSQQIGAIGTKGSTYGGQQYLGYGGGAPHEAGGAAPPPPPYATALPPPSMVRTAPPPQAAPPPPQLQPPNTYYSQTTGGQTGFYQQPGSVTANYGLQFGQPNQSHSNTSIQGFGSQVLSNQFQLAMQQQYGRAAQQAQPNAAAAAYGVSAGQQQSAQVPNGASLTTQGKQQQEHHQSRPQQLKSPLQDHQNNGMFCNLSQQPPQPQSAPPAPYASVLPPQPQLIQQHAQQSGTHSPKVGTPNSTMNISSNKSSNSSNNNSTGTNPSVGIVSGNTAGNGGNGNAVVYQQQQNTVKQQHSPPHHKYNYHMQQVMQGNGRQASLNMAINRGGGGMPQQRYPPPIQRPPPPMLHQPPPSYSYPTYRGGNNSVGNNNRHPSNNNNGATHQRQGGGYYQQNNRTNNQTVTSSTSDQTKAVSVSGEEACPSPAATATTEQQSTTSTSTTQPPTNISTAVEIPVTDKKAE